MVKDIKVCEYCGKQGEFGKDIVMVDLYRGWVFGCRDIDACHERSDAQHARLAKQSKAISEMLFGEGK